MWNSKSSKRIIDVQKHIEVLLFYLESKNIAGLTVASKTHDRRLIKKN
jgi:hypothetical protein